MAKLDSTAVWDPGLFMLSNEHPLTRQQGQQGLYDGVMIEPHVTSCSFSELIENYEGIWRRFNKETISLSTMRDELIRCEQELLKQKLYCSNDSSEHTASMTTLLHVCHVFSVLGQENKKCWVLLALKMQLATKSETDLYHIYKEYIEQLMIRKSMVTEKDLCIKDIDPYYEFQLKLCVGEKLIQQEKYKQYKEFIVKNGILVMLMIKEMKKRKDYKTMSKSCIFLLCVLNINLSWLQPLKNMIQRELSFLLTMLQAEHCYKTLIQYSEQNNMTNLSVRLDDLSSINGRIYHLLQLKLIVLNCVILIKHKHYQLYQNYMVKNLHLLLDWKKSISNNDSSRSCHKIDTMWNRINTPTSLLSSLMSMLPEEELYKTISHYLFLVKDMRSFIVPKYLHSVKTDPYLNLLFKLFWCRKLINEGHADSNIVYRCLNSFYREKCQEKEAEFTVYIISIADNLSDTGFLKDSLLCYLRKNLKTVTSMATTLYSNERSEYNKKLKSSQNKSKQDLIYTQCASILSGKKMKNVDIQQFSRKFNMKGPEDENEVETESEQIKLLILLMLLLLLTTLGHKSAKLKKYLALKYEYDMASLYLLWCSGDIEVHPGPPWRRKQLEHNSERERKWLQDINSILLKLYLQIPTQSKPKSLWQNDNQPEQWPSDKPFYDTKNASKDAEGNKITDDEILTCLLECLKKKKVDIPHIYQSEISAWTNKNIQLLHKLQVYRIEMEKLKSASINLFLSNLEDDAKNLQKIKISLENPTLNKKQTEDLLNTDLRQKEQAEFVAEITRDLANTLCRLAKGTDTMKKGDGIWNRPPPVDWPDDVPFFNPKNRGKNKDKPKCPDTVLVCTFLKLSYLRIPENILQIVNAYQTMYNCTDTDRKKKNKEKLCRLYTVQSNLEKLDCSLHNLHKEGLFSREVHGILKQWWNTQSVDEHAVHVLKNAIVRSDERPYITIDITKNYEPDADLRYISYTIPIKDAYLHIKCTEVHPNQSSHEQPITESLMTANCPENIADSVLPPNVIDFVLEHELANQNKCPNDNSVTDNRPNPFDLQGTPLPIRHQHLKPHNDLDTLTTHKTLSPDLNGSRCTKEYDTTSLKACDFVHSSNSRNGENISGNMGISKVKRKQIEDDEEPVKKLLKTKVNQLGHYNRTDEEISSSESKNDGGFQEPNHISTSNQHEICSANVQDLPSLELSLSDIIDSIGDKCNSKPSKDSVTFQQICDLEKINSSNQQDSHENIDELKNNDNQMDHTEEHQNCLEMIKSLYR